jgi:F-type H+-transporting ATPase subunit b
MPANKDNRMSLLKRFTVMTALVGLFLLGSSNFVRAAEEHAAPSGSAQATAEEHETKAPLVPDVTSGQTWAQALWTIVIFVIMLAILYPTAWKNVLAGLKKREERIRKDIADAEAARLRSESTLKEYNAQLAAAEARGRDILNKATTDAEALATNIRNRAQQESEEIKDRATKDIEAARAQAVADVHRQAAELATLVAEKILRRNLNTSDQEDLVRQSLDQMQTVSKN